MLMFKPSLLFFTSIENTYFSEVNFCKSDELSAEQLHTKFETLRFTTWTKRKKLLFGLHWHCY